MIFSGKTQYDSWIKGFYEGENSFKCIISVLSAILGAFTLPFCRKSRKLRIFFAVAYFLDIIQNRSREVLKSKLMVFLVNHLTYSRI